MNIIWRQKALLLGGVIVTVAPLCIYADFASTTTPHTTASRRPEMVTYPLDIKFETGKAVIQSVPQNDAEFKKLVAELNNYPNAKAEIQGYADATGSEERNRKLSAERAEAVRQRFVDGYGISADRIRTQSFGEAKPVATNRTSAGRARNRRVVALVYRLEVNEPWPDARSF